MLIDARHREETRVAVVNGTRIEEFDFESSEHKQLKGNIYLAKVTRVEPSLQAAFVDYGGNRHGFLAFSEIHPDYYQIPKEDRDALLREEAEHAAEEAALRAEHDLDEDDELHDDDGLAEDDHGDDHADDIDEESVERFEDDGGVEAEVAAEDAGEARPRRRGKRSAADAAVEDLRERRSNLRHRYKIQDVIRRRQVLLVQVVKEERGNKGAALTSYLSLAGRYCVLMPNTSHGGGISRKISNAGDRKRLKSIMADMQLPPSMGCIVRTAGLQRTRQEIRRDFDYLARLWDGIRETTLASSAPALVYGDSDLLKRAIRDIYNKDIDEVIVEGEDGYRQAREFMKLLMPSHARKVKHYSDAVPLFQRAHVEDQLGAMYHPVVQLKSGGYLVINPTEALVSIDINSGRSTREHSIEQTATATNLEATQEIARQLRLRDMAGLVVIDFIDMDNGSNVRKVEKAMKDALKNDRARIQVGRISSFGLMEMSRQRLRTGVLEASTRQCPHCEGTGLVRTASSAGLSALRLIEDEAAQGRGSVLTLHASMEAAFYLLNRKRGELAEIEDRYGVTVEVTADGEAEGARMSVEVAGPPPAHAPRFAAPIQEVEEDYPEDIEDEIEVEDEEEEAPRVTRAPRDRGDRPERSADESNDEGGGRKRRRRRGRRGRNRTEGDNGEASVEGVEGESLDVEGGEALDIETDADTDGEAPAEFVGEQPVANGEEGEGRRRRGRRGRRGGRRNEGERALDSETAPALDASDEVPVVAEPAPQPEPEAPAAEVEDAPKKGRRRPRARTADAASAVEAAPVVDATVAEAPAAEAEPEAPAKPKRSRRKAATAEAAPAEAPAVESPAMMDVPVSEEPAPKPKRKPRAKKSDAPVEAEAPAAEQPANDTAPAVPESLEREIDADPGEAGSPRRGWWQRTFGA
ncbi:Rne/Rng family ribonuclease [Sphingomonas aliaeris]|uniref:Ribonuclease E n=2 Tax=Sphingomonas aliaeris TaxID=2759526 RepID=A0A974S5V5_9SPHN|nr:Rne/Rng family ribonuclease [Sphingomonas aliaeris]